MLLVMLVCFFSGLHSMFAPVSVIPEATPKPKPKTEAPKPKPKAEAPPKPKPKSNPNPVSDMVPKNLDPGSEFSMRFVGTWVGSRTGSGAISGRDRQYRYSVSTPVTATISNRGRLANIRLGDGTIRWADVGPDGQAVSNSSAKPAPAFALHEETGALTGSYHVSEGSWTGDRVVRISFDGGGDTLRLTIEHSSRNRQSGTSDHSTSEATLRRAN